MPDKKNKKIFYALVLVAFISVTVYAFLTPMMSDDIFYGNIVRGAGNFFDLFKQEYEHYMTHGGRSVGHFILRVFLFTGSKGFFNIVSGIVFTILSLLIYANIDSRKKYDIRMYGFALLFMWLLDPTMASTVFWETGACNYLFTTTIILAFMTCYRKKMLLGLNEKPKTVVLMFIGGFFAGWCNENTSGGVILFILLLLFLRYREEKNFGFVKPWMISGLVGSIISFLIMISSPGNYSREGSAATVENHTGIVSYAARFLKITLNIKEHYIILVLLFAVLLIVIRYMAASWSKFLEMTAYMRLMGFVALATALALVFVPGGTQLRTYFGAGVFLMIAVLNGVAVVANTVMMGDDSAKFPDGIMQAVVTSCAVVMGILFLFTYIEQGANLAWIKREYDERDTYLTQQAESGVRDAFIPMLRPQWESRYSYAYESDITDDCDYWINGFYRDEYGFDNVTGVPRDEWNEQQE